MYDRSKAFVLQAGKVIIAVSIILWVMASYGPGNRFEKIDKKYSSSEYTKTPHLMICATPLPPKNWRTVMPGIRSCDRARHQALRL
jgi:Fe2+ transport system protein B